MSRQHCYIKGLVVVKIIDCQLVKLPCKGLSKKEAGGNVSAAILLQIKLMIGGYEKELSRQYIEAHMMNNSIDNTHIIRKLR